jgi:hypothetical protein
MALGKPASNILSYGYGGLGDTTMILTFSILQWNSSFSISFRRALEKSSCRYYGWWCNSYLWNINGMRLGVCCLLVDSILNDQKEMILVLFC